MKLRSKGLILVLLMLCTSSFVFSQEQETEDLKRVELSIYTPQPQDYFVNSNYQTGSILTTPWYDYQSKGVYIALDANFSMRSNSITPKFTSSLLNNGLNNEIRDNVSSKLKENNKYEDNLSLSLTFAKYSNKLPVIGEGYYFIKVKSFSQRHAYFNDNTFKLIFEGNAQFEDETVEMPLVNLSNEFYNQFQVGFNKFIRNDKGGLVEAGLGLSFYQSPINNDFSLKNGSLYTAVDGEYIDATYNMNFNQTEDTPFKLFDTKGIGFGADFHFAYYKNANFGFKLDVQNLGLVNYKNGTNFNADSSVHYEGIIVKNVLQLDRGINFNTDSLQSILGLHEKQESYSSITPIVINASFHKKLDNQGRHVLSLGFQHKMIEKYVPLVYAKYNYKPGMNYIISGSAAYGGYGSYSVGIEGSKYFSNVHLAIGSSDVLGLIAPSTFTSSSAYMKVAVAF